MSCFIKDNKGRTIYAEANNGERSILFDELKKRTPDNAEDLYTITVTEDFLEEVVKPKNILVKKSVTGVKGATQLDNIENVTNRIDNLNLAVQLEKEGKSKRYIKKLTMWERNPIDNKWRFEIPDGNLKTIDLKEGETYRLSDIVEGNDLIKIYGDLKINIIEDDGTTVYGGYDPVSDSINISARTMEHIFPKKSGTNEGGHNVELWETLLHELGHKVQYVEGYGTGGGATTVFERASVLIGKNLLVEPEEGNVALIEQKLKDNNLNLSDKNILKGVLRYYKEPNRVKRLQVQQELYQTISGEVEARAIVKRNTYFDFDISNSLISDDFDITPEDQIYINQATKQLSLKRNLSLPVTEQLEKTGLAKKVNILTNSEIEEKLGSIQDEVKKQQVLNTEMGKIKEDAISQGIFMKAPNGRTTNLTENQWLQTRTKAFKEWFGDWEDDPESASKVLDKNGEPLVVYHGSSSTDIEVFNREGATRISSGLKEFGTYFTTNKKLANLYRNIEQSPEKRIELDAEIDKLWKSLDNVRSNKEWNAIMKEIDILSERGRIYPVFLNLKKIHTFDGKGRAGISAWNNLEVKASYKIASNRDAMEFLKDGKFGVQQVDGIKAENISDVSEFNPDLDSFLGDVYLVFDGKEGAIKSAEGNSGEFSTETLNIFKQKEKGQAPNGFVYNGQVYLNKDKMSPNTSIHEFGHLYLDFLNQNNKEIYDAGLSLIEKNKEEAQSYIDFVNTNQPDLKEGSEEWKNEVLAQVIGDNGARLVGSNLKTWLQEFWNAVKDILGLSQYTAEQVSNMTLKQFGEAVSKDLLSGENLTGTFKSNGVTINYRPRINPITNQQLGGIDLELINTPQDLRGQGRAKKALREFLLITDREGQDVYLFASPRDKTTTEKGLINFYRSLGFTSDQFLPQEMVRRARNVNRTPKPIAAQFDKNGEVFAKDVYEYVDRKNAEGIVPTQEDRVNIIKALDTQTPSSDALLERTRKAFYRNGLFAPTMATLTNNGYTKGEATNILSDISLQARIKENIAKIQNLKEPISIDEVEVSYNTISSMEPNFVGKYQQANPYITQKQIVDTLGGIKDKNEFDSAVVENSMEVAKNDFEDLSQYTEVIIKEVQPDGTITERKLNRTAEKFQETLTDPSNDELRKEIDYILNIPPDIAQTSQSEIADLLEELREKAVDIGLDLTDIGQKYTEKGIGELTRFLVALRTLNAQNLQNFAQVYDSFFDVDTDAVETEKIKGATQTTEKIYNKQKTAFEMFAENGLLYQGNNLYKRTNNRKSLEETLNIMEKRPEMFPQGIFEGTNITNTAQVRDRIENYTNEQVQEIETGNLFDADKLKVYFLNTVYFGTPTNIQENIKDVESIVDKEIDTQYLSTDFIADFNKQSLKEKIKGSQKYRDFYSNFNITKDGIEPLNIDPLSIQIMEEYMDEDTRNYFSLKKDSNVFAQAEEPSYADDVLAERNRTINFPKSLPLYKGQFEQKSARTIKVKNPTDNFIRTRDGVYELTERNSTDGYYAKLPHNTSPYILLTDMVPEIDVEMDSPENVKEPEIKVKNLYTKQEEQQINSELECG